LHQVGKEASAYDRQNAHREDGFSPIVLNAIGDELMVPRAKWAELLASPGVKALMDRDIAEGNALQLPHVPVAYVNGRPVDSQRLPETIDRLCQ